MYTVKFNEVGKNDINLVGGKGANLGELTRNKVSVPNGFIVTTTAYEEYLQENKIDTMMDKVEEGKEAELSKALREKISKGKFPEKILKEITKSFKEMEGSTRVAVRSSATAEDLGSASFAGQQETYLNVQGFEDVLQRIKDCFASCFSERSVKYRTQAGLGYDEVKAAVVVQQMVESEVSGVLFTANVITKNKDEMLINASYGLGEAVVSGMVNPDQYILDKSGRILKKTLGRKEQKIIYGNKETVTVQVDKDKQSMWSLTDKDVNELYKAGRNIENLYGKSMDIEWAKFNKKIYILQARAITTLVEYEKTPESSLKMKKIKLSKMQMKNLTFMLEHVPYAYYPLDYEVSMIQGAAKTKVFRELGINNPKMFKMDDNGVVTLLTGRMKFNRNIMHIFRNIKQFTNIEDNRSKGKALFDKFTSKLEEIEKIDLSKRLLADYADIFHDLEEVQNEIGYDRFRYFIFPSVLIGKKLNKYLKGQDKLNEYDLLSNLPYRTWQINKDINTLAAEIVSDINGSVDINEKIPSSVWNRESSKISTFLKKHGYKSDLNCYPFSAVSWNEDKEGLYKLLEVSMRGIKKEEESNKYDELIKLLKEKCGSKQDDVLAKVDYYRECHVYREESQYMWEKCFAMFRKVLKNAAVKLNVPVKDLWFLMYSEMTAACRRGCLSKEDIENIRKRKTFRKQAEANWDYMQSLTVVSSGDDSELRGVSGSSGIKTGTACIVLDKSDFAKLKNGDILICNFTSPEWTPLFSLASAVVSDTGGALSHAAIVAREYGIPAVLGTGNATKVIHDGDKISVDGTNGKVVVC